MTELSLLTFPTESKPGKTLRPFATRVAKDSTVIRRAATVIFSLCCNITIVLTVLRPISNRVKDKVDSQLSFCTSPRKPTVFHVFLREEISN